MYSSDFGRRPLLPSPAFTVGPPGSATRDRMRSIPKRVAAERATAALAAIILATSPAMSPAVAISDTAGEVRGLLRKHYLDAEALSRLPPDADATTLVRRLGDRYSQLLSRQEVAKLLLRKKQNLILN